MFRKILTVALVAAPMMLVPAHVDAQQRGSDRAAAARGQAAPQAAQQNRPSEAPEGLRKAFEGRTPPAALLRRFPDLAPQPEPVLQPEPAPAPAPAPVEDCPTSMSITPDGQFVEVDCHGNVIGIE